VVRAGTQAAALGRAGLGHLSISATGDASIVELVEGELDYRDVLGELQRGDRPLTARGPVVAGRWRHSPQG